MLKKMGFPALALAAALTLFTPHAASARTHWHFGSCIADLNVAAISAVVFEEAVSTARPAAGTDSRDA